MDKRVLNGCKRTLQTGLTISIFAALVACATNNNSPERSSTMKKIDAELPRKDVAEPMPVGTKTIPMAVQNALLPSLHSSSSELLTRYSERFDVAVNQENAREFFMGLVADTNTNMAVHPDVSGEITLSLKKVTVDEVLEITKNLFGYDYEKTSGGYQIFPKQLQTRIFQLNYLNVNRAGKSLTIVSSGQISRASSGSSGGQNSSGQNSSNNTSGTSGSGQNNASTIASSSIETDSKADFWKLFSDSISSIIGEKENRNVVINPQTGVMIVRAMPDELRAIEDYLKITQKILRRQVHIEAKIIEVTLSDGFQAGINWAALGEPKSGQSIVVGQTGGGSLFSTGTSEIAGNTGVLNPNALSQVENTATSAFGGMFSVAANLNDFNVFIELLKGQGDVQVLSSPRVSTVNNQKAVIKVGTDEFFVTDISNNTTTGTATNSAQDITLTPFFSGIALDVTPQIDEDENIVLHIHPSISDVQDQTKTITVNSESQTLPLALSSIRETDSIVQTKSGRVVVIGGLMQDKHNKSKASIPLLGDIPGLGKLFQHNRESNTKSELVILLRVVAADDEQWQPILDKTTNSFQTIQH